MGTSRPRQADRSAAYAIGKAHPVSLFVETFGTENVPVERIEKAIKEIFDLRPAAIIRDLDLLRPIYQRTAAYGHFGRELPELRWASTDRAQDLKNAGCWTRHTARFVCTTDADHCQIASFYSGAMAEAPLIDLDAIGVALGTPAHVLIGPGQPEAMIRHALTCRERSGASRPTRRSSWPGWTASKR